MLDKLRSKMFGISLSQAHTLVLESIQKNSKHWFKRPIEIMIELFGDMPVRKVTPEHLNTWFDTVINLPNARRPGEKLSAWTIDSYTRAMRAFFNRLVELNHLEKSPYHLRLSKLPIKGGKAISEEELKRMLHYARMYPRDYAFILVLRDSGVRISGLINMTLSGTYIDRYYETTDERGKIKIVTLGDDEGTGNLEGIFTDKGLIYPEIKLRGRSLVGTKMNKKVWIHFGHEACLAIEHYLEFRPYEAGNALWLGNDDRPLKPNGVYQALKRIAKKAGVKRYNPHAFRHALAKKLMKDGVAIRIIQEFLGHEDPTTTMKMYMEIDENELGDYHTQFVKFD